MLGLVYRLGIGLVQEFRLEFWLRIALGLGLRLDFRFR